MKRLRDLIPVIIVLVSLTGLILSSNGDAQTVAPLSQQRNCETVKQFKQFSNSVWQKSRWHRGAPPHKVIRAQRAKLACAGPRDRAHMKKAWRTDKRRFYAKRHHCRGGTTIVGRVSVFGGSSSASGLPASSTPGIALNINPGTESGWNNSLTNQWVSTLQKFRVTVDGHSAILPQIDKGPAGFTERAIDITYAGAAALGGVTTDHIGTAKLIPEGCI